MPEIQGIEKLLSALPRKRFGRFNQLGMHQLGYSWFGDSDIFLARSPLGAFVLGFAEIGDLIQLSGIYRTDNVTGCIKYYREPYYITKNPRTGPQQAQRQKLVGLPAAWKALQPEQREEYNQRAFGKHMSGYNLFIREFLNG